MIGRIYKIAHLQSDVYYIGMTTNLLSKRWSCYKSHYNNGNGNDKISIYPYMRKFGIENFKILLIKEYDVVDKQHLMVYETLWINKLNPINKIVSFNPIFSGDVFRTRYNESYYQKNKERIIWGVRNYASNNKEKIRERGISYRDKNKEQIKAKKAERFECECGGSWSRGHGFKRHYHTKKHQAYIS